jgi:hypothetical protein
MSRPQTSAQVLQRLWQQFAARCNEEGRLDATKGGISRRLWVGADRNVLSRWTNPKQAKWRLPMTRVAEVARVLRLTSVERNELMESVVNERLANDPNGELAVFAQWLVQVFDEQFSPSEQQVLRLWRETSASCNWELAGDKHEEVLLREAFRNALEHAAAQHGLDAQGAEQEREPEPTAEEREATHVGRRTALKKVNLAAARRRAALARDEGLEQAQALLERARRDAAG